jgi:nicotinamide-nucleotide amidase
MRCEIIATGTELLSGGILDTNSLFLSEELMLVGLQTAFKTVVGDSDKDMEDAIQKALERTDAVIITGGLGPTEDDMTRKAIARIAKKRLVLNEQALKSIHAKLAHRPKAIIAANDRQALIPTGAKLLPNPVGIAPGFVIDEEDMFLAVLPGVPREMEAMYQQALRPVLAHRFAEKAFIRRTVLRTAGLSESAVNTAIQGIMKSSTATIGMCARESGVEVRIITKGSTAEQSQSLLDRTATAIREKLGDAVYGTDAMELEEVVGALLKQRKLTLSVAESCTGGMIASKITNIAGSSQYFERGVVVYSYASKTDLLNVPGELIERHGAVSSEVAAAMADGMRRNAKTDIALSVTGIAGPDGGTAKKPVGLVYIGLASKEGIQTVENRFLGGREQIRSRTAHMALDMVRKYLIA